MKRSILFVIGVFTWLLNTSEVSGQCTGNPFNDITITDIQNVTCNGGFDGSITVEIDGGEAPFVYELVLDQGGAGVTPLLSSPSTNDTEYIFLNLPAESVAGGNYRIIVKTSNDHPSGIPILVASCSEKRIDDIDLTQPDAIVLNTGALTLTGNTQCTGTPDGSIELNASVSGGTAPYEYSFEGGAFAATTLFSDLSQGDYTITVQDALGCTEDFIITVPDNRVAPTATISPDPAEVCINVDLALDGNPAGGSGTYTTHSWTGDTGPLSATNIQNPTFNSAATGTFNLTYTVTDDNGCSISDDITITVNPEPTANDQTPTVCEDNPGTGQADVDLTALEGSINGGGGITYSWFTDAGLTSPIATPTNFTVSDGVPVYVQVDDGTCTGVATVTYTVNSQPTANDQTPVVCEDAFGTGQATVNLTGLNAAIDGGAGHTITWYLDPALTNPVADATNEIVGDGQILYAEVDDGACTNVATATYTVNSQPTANDQTPVVCEDVFGTGQATVNLTGLNAAIDGGAGHTITWYLDPTLTNPVTDATSETVSDTQILYAEVDDGTCTNVATATYTVNSQPVANDQNPTVCEDNPGTGQATVDLTTQESSVNGGGGLTFNWFIDAGLTNPIATPANFTVSDGVPVYVQVSDGSCENVAEVTYTVTPLPGDPTNVQATNVACTSFDASWDASTDAVDYLVELIDIDAGDTYAAPTQSQTTAAITVTFTGLTEGTTYEFRVTPRNACGDGNAVQSAQFDTDALPEVPTNLAASNEQCTQFDLSWDAAANATDYTVEVYDDPGLTSLVTQQTIAATSTTITGLTASTTYYFQVRGENACGESAFTVAGSTSTNPLPADPTNVQAINIDCQEFEASWDAVADADDYLVEVIDVDAGDTYVSPTFSQVVAAPTTTHVFNGLTEGTTYEFRVTARNVCGDSNPVQSAQFATNPLPDPITGDTPSNATCVGFDLSWDTSTGAVTYLVEADDDAGFGSVDETTTIGVTSYTFTALAANTTYFYRITPQNTCGDGTPATGSFSTATTPLAPTNLVVSNITCDAFDLSWDASAGAVDYLVEVDDDPAFASVDFTVDDPATTANVTGLNIGTTYFYRVTPRNTCGDGIAASGSTSTTDVPGAVTGLAVSDVFCTEFTISWDAIVGADDYLVEVSDDGFGTLVANPVILSPNTSTTISGLNPGATYEFRVTARNTCGDGPITNGAAPVTTDNLPTAADQTPVVCEDTQGGGVATVDLTALQSSVNGGAGLTFNWFEDVGLTTPVADVTAHPVIDGANVFVEVVENASCTNVATVTYTVNSQPTANSQTPVVCEGAFGTGQAAVNLTSLNAAIDGGASNTIIWYLDNGLTNPVADATNETVSDGQVLYAEVDNGNCTNVATAQYTINSIDDASFSYASATFCQDEPNPSPNSVTTPGGTFSSTVGLVFVDNLTGEIDLVGSTPGNYTITYTTAGTCPADGTFDITINTVDDPAFSYAVTTFCQNDPNPSPNSVTTPDGTFSNSSGLVFVDASTGEIDLAGSASGTHTITYTTGGTCPASTTLDVTINPVEDASFSYSSGTYCADDANPTPTVTTVGGTFTSSDPANLVVVPNGAGAGTIDIAASTVGGPYTITYSFGGACPSSETFQVTITNSADAEFTYAGSPYCQGDTDPTPTFTTGSAGVFSSTAGLVIDAGTGEIDLSASTPGNYTVTNAISGSCGDTQTFAIEILADDDPTFSYASANYCQSDPNPSPNSIATPGGTFSSGAGLDINAATGEIDLIVSTPGFYTITYTTNGTCPTNSTFDVTINAGDDPSFSYASNTFCQDDPNPLPNSITTPGGMFSNGSGLTFVDNLTGEIDLAGSTAGTHIITYTTSGVCPTNSTFSVTINAIPEANDQTPAVCEDAVGGGTADVDLTALEGVIHTGAGTIDWFEDSGLTIAIGVPNNFTVTNSQSVFARVTETGCTNVAQVTYTVNGVPAVADQTPAVCEDTEGGGTATVSLTALEPAIDAGAGFTYTWYTDATLTTPVADPGNTVVSDGNEFYAEADNGSCTNVAQVTYIVNALPTVSLGGLTSPYCNTDATANSITYSPVGGTLTGVGITDNFDGTASFNPNGAGPGTHTITYSFTDANGCTNQTSQAVIVNDCTAGPVANFTADITTVCEGNTVTFTDASSGATTYNWDFGAGATPATATGVGPHVVTYNTAGLATINLTIDQGLGTENTETKADFITIATSDDPTFSYLLNSYCPTDGDQSPDNITTPGGTFTSTAGLVINAASGVIDVAGSIAGPYTIKYVTAGVCPDSSTFDVTIQPAEDASFDYGGVTTFCQNDANPMAVVTGDAGGTFSGTAGLVFINTTTGEIDLANSTDGPHTVTYTTTGLCSVSEDLLIEITTVPDPTISYSSGTYCISDTDPTPTRATGGGIFTADAGIVFTNATTGVIDLSNSTPGGPYNVIYTFTGACTSADTFQITITNSADAEFSYAGSPYCQGDGSISPVFSPGASAGTFSSTAGLVINAGTGEIDLSASTPGTYTVTNTISSGSCNDSRSTVIQILPDGDPGFNYGGVTTFCRTDADPTVTITGDTGGEFVSSDPANLVVVPNGVGAGTIDLSASTAGVYTVTYSTPGTCSADSIITVTITDPAASNLSYNAAAFCVGTGTQLPTDPAVPNGTFTSSDGALIVDAVTGEIDVNASTVGTYTITYTPSDACTATATFDIDIQATPTADAGVADASCTLEYQLNGNTPVAGTGMWTTISQPGGSTIFFDDPTSSNAIATVDIVGTYRFQWEVTNGVCTPVSDEVEIDFADPLMVTHSRATNNYSDAQCNGLGLGSFEVSVSGGSGSYTYSWSGNDWDGNTISDTDSFLNEQQGPFPNLGVAGGIYTLTVTDAGSGCDTTIVAVIGNSDLTTGAAGSGADVEVTATPSCAGGSNGDIEVGVPASANSYLVRFYDSLGAVQYTSGSFVGNGGTTARFSDSGVGLAAGTYYIEVADLSSNESCRAGDTVVVTTVAAPVITVDSQVDPSCAGGLDGSIDVSITGGVGPFTFEWRQDGTPAFATTEDITGAPTGGYQLIVTDNGTGCEATSLEITLSDPPLAAGPNAQTPLPSITCNSFTAQWDEVPGAEYRVDVATDAAFTAPLIVDNATVAVGTFELDVTGLMADTDYFYRVRSIVGTCPSDNSDTITVRTEDAPVTTALPATGVACDAFTANWTEVPGAEYRVDVATDAAFTAPLVIDNATVAAGTFELDVTGLISGTVYFYRIRAIDPVCGLSVDSNVGSTTTLGTPLAAPTNVVPSNPVCDGFTLTWDAVTDAVNYRVEASDNGFVTIVSQIAPGSTPPATITATFNGLTASTTYEYRITSIGACGDGSTTTPASFDTRDVPVTPTVTASNPGCNGFTLNWVLDANTDDFLVEVDDDPTFASIDFTDSTIVDKINVTGLVLIGTTYHYRITPRNACGDGVAATGSTDTRGAPDQPIVSETTTCDGFTLNWNADANTDDYVIEVDDDPTFASINSSDTTATDNITFSGLTQGATYFYRVLPRNVCDDGVIASGSVTVDDLPGNLPGAPTASAPTCTGFDIAWGAVASTSGYRVEVSPVSDNFASDIDTLIATGTDTTFTTLNEETDYLYRVTPINSCDDGGTTVGASSISTNQAVDCGCGFDLAAFNVVPTNASCIGAKDGQIQVFTETSSTAPPSRFRFRYQSLDDPTILSPWDSTSSNLTGIGFVVFDPDTVSAGDYRIIIEDRNPGPTCQVADTIEVQVGVQNDIEVSVRAETCTVLGAISLEIPDGCLDDIIPQYEVFYTNENGVEESINYIIEPPGSNTFIDLASGDYRITIGNFNISTQQVDSITSIRAFVPNNCSVVGGDTTLTSCLLDGRLVIPSTTLTECGASTGALELTVQGGESENFTFTIQSSDGIVRTESGLGSVIFSDVPTGRYIYTVVTEDGNANCSGSARIGDNGITFTTERILPDCDDPDQTADLTVTVDTLFSAASAPYDVHAVLGNDTISTAFIDINETATTLTGLPTGQNYQVTVASRDENACPKTETVPIPGTGEDALAFVPRPQSITCFGEFGSVTIDSIQAVDGLSLKFLLYRVDQLDAIDEAAFNRLPLSYTFEQLQPGDYQIELEQQQGSCDRVSRIRSETFRIEGPTAPLEADVPENVTATVEYPYGNIEVNEIRGGVAPYEVRIAVDPTGNSQDWVEVVNDNPAINPFQYVFMDQTLGNYQVEVRDQLGCVKSFIVSIDYTDELYIPNIFTPNGDGDNDTFQIINLDKFTSSDNGASIIITSRWGNKVFESDAYTEENFWDGEEYPDGLYFYQLTLPGGESHNGWVEIWRGRTP
ncbi:MAG: fibronectin type III domain-containing protein [Bacteroidota bacterium]